MSEYSNVRRFEKLPDCAYSSPVKLRVYREKGKPDALEMIYFDAWGEAFWGPIPVVEAPVK